MPEEQRKNDNEIRERLTRVEEACKVSSNSLIRIELMLAKHIELDDPIKEQVILNTEHRKTSANMILGLWTSVIGIIGAGIISLIKE